MALVPCLLSYHKNSGRPDDVTEYAQDLRSLLDEATSTERRAFVRNFVRVIQVMGKQAVLTHTIPAPPDTTSSAKGAA